MDKDDFIRIDADKMRSEFDRVLVSYGFNREKARQCAEIFLDNSLEGVYSHGVNRFPRFIKNIREGYVKPDAYPALVHKAGPLEQWDGNIGPGPLNAVFATDRATELAKENTIGLVAMANTNHWMRAGTYGWQAARKGFIFICWTNTCPNMPAWGAADPRLGNNPMVIAVPYKEDGIVLDFAMSQFAYGKLESYRDAGMKLPYPGGYSKSGELTSDPAEILESWRILPTGFWKGSGLSLMLDILAAVISGGLSTHEVKSCISETKISQVFIAIDPSKLGNSQSYPATIERIITNLHRSVPSEKGTKVRYPGENIASIKEDNLKNGIPVKNDIWNKILSL